jgi:hypothetical protein
MFLYRTEVKPATNPAMGLGLFALEFIPNYSEFDSLFKDYEKDMI